MTDGGISVFLGMLNLGSRPKNWFRTRALGLSAAALAAAWAVASPLIRPLYRR